MIKRICFELLLVLLKALLRVLARIGCRGRTISGRGLRFRVGELEEKSLDYLGGLGKAVVSKS
jgi:hypothetical protein